MDAMILRRLALGTGAMIALALTGQALAGSPGALPEPAPHEHMAESWPLVAFARDGDCEVTVRGNGRFFRISATGLEPAEAARLYIANGDMRPISRPVRASGEGTFSDFYLPFRWHREGGEVTVAVATANCVPQASFPWQRSIPVHD